MISLLKSLSIWQQLAIVPLVASPLTPAMANPTEASLAALDAIGREGAGNVEATAAWQDLAGGETSSLPALLTAMGDASPIAANYLRLAAETIADRDGGDGLPIEALSTFLFDTGNDAKARRFAFDLIARSEPAAAEALIPGFLGDPAPELRRDAVDQLLESARETEGDGATLLYRQALGAARDVDQIKVAAEALEEAGIAIDVPRQFGFLMRWKTIAPFDNSGLAGFAAVFPPEEGIDLDARYAGKDGQEIGWQETLTSSDFGMVDLNKPYGNLKEVVGFASTEFESATSRPAELRLGCKNAWKLWLNGELVFARDEYHRGMRIDQYTLPVQLQAGKNTLLLKLCQNEVSQEWMKEWQFQLRVCDASGAAILAENRLPTPGPTSPKNRRKRD